MINRLLLPIAVLNFLIGFLVLILPVSVIVAPLPVYYRYVIARNFWYLFCNFILRFVFFSKVTKIDNREGNQSLYPKGLYIANHQSFIDIPLMFSNLVVPPIMKKEILHIPIFGLCAYSAGAMIVDRKNQESRRKVFSDGGRRLLGQFKNLQYYPEGTRNKKSPGPKPLSEIKKPFIEFAYDNNIPVYSISMYGTNKILFQSSLVKFKIPLGIKIYDAILPSQYETKEEFVEKAWSQVVEGWGQLEQKLTTGIK